MFTEDTQTHTRTMGEQNNTQTVLNEEVAASEQQKPAKGKAINLKQVAGFVAGAAAGAAASLAVDAFANGSGSMSEPDAEPIADAEPVVAPAPQPTAQPASQPQVREAQPEPSARQAVHQEPQQQTERGEDQFFRDHEVKIQEIGTHETSDGYVVHTAAGTVNGHNAVFVDDGHGTVTEYAVDQNDNQQIEDSEIVHVEGQDLTMGDLAEHLVEVEAVPEPTATQASDVRVIAVENDVTMGEHTVNVAMVTVGDTEGLLIDANQDGEVNVMAMDANHDGDFSENELQNVTGAHIPMPTQEDTQSYVAQTDDLPDYSNDSDITVYDV